MFEAQLEKASLLKKIIDSIKDLVTDANIEITESGLTVQAIDSSHVSLVSLQMNTHLFGHFRCDRSATLGLNLANLGKILKCAGNDDSVTLKAQEDGDVLTIAFESPGQERVSEFALKLMDIDGEHLGIPEQEYQTTTKMNAAEFQRIVRDMAVLGDSCTIAVTKEGISFDVKGDMGNGVIKLRQNASVDKEEDQLEVQMDEPVELSFALRYLGFFTKATPLNSRVTLAMSPEVPVAVTYNVGDEDGMGSLSFYLAPKIDEE